MFLELTERGQGNPTDSIFVSERVMVPPFAKHRSWVNKARHVSTKKPVTHDAEEHSIN